MVFADNFLRLEFAAEGKDADLSARPQLVSLEFSPLSALRRVNDHQDLVHVSAAEKWQDARKDSPHIGNIVKPYDWTFTPSGYKGEAAGDGLIEEPTSARIDYEKLKEKERILFYDEVCVTYGTVVLLFPNWNTVMCFFLQVILYEDELDDNGCAKLSAKIVRSSLSPPTILNALDSSLLSRSTEGDAEWVLLPGSVLPAGGLDPDQGGGHSPLPQRFVAEQRRRRRRRRRQGASNPPHQRAHGEGIFCQGIAGMS